MAEIKEENKLTQFLFWRSVEQIPCPLGGLTKKKPGHALLLVAGYLTEDTEWTYLFSIL